jgi:SAM-dependent methyltransferase
MTSETANPEAVREKVREGYGAIARQGGSCCGPAKSCCGGGNAEAVATAVGYDEAELAALPDGVNMGLSCGNPTAIAELQHGEVVLDLGSGGGFDVFIAARKIGPTGKAIGVDMTADMLAKARKNAITFKEKAGLENVEFRLGEIEHLPLADSSVDVIISNCVINLSPDKPQVWREMFRVLKPGGRVAVSDLALLQPIPPNVAEMVEALVGCIAGAILVKETERMAREAGLDNITLTEKQGYVEALTDWKDPLFKKVLENLPPGAKMSDFVTNLYVSAKKPLA